MAWTQPKKDEPPAYTGERKARRLFRLHQLMDEVQAFAVTASDPHEEAALRDAVATIRRAVGFVAR